MMDGTDCSRVHLSRIAADESVSRTDTLLIAPWSSITPLSVRVGQLPENRIVDQVLPRPNWQTNIEEAQEAVSSRRGLRRVLGLLDEPLKGGDKSPRVWLGEDNFLRRVKDRAFLLYADRVFVALYHPDPVASPFPFVQELTHAFNSLLAVVGAWAGARSEAKAESNSEDEGIEGQPDPIAGRIVGVGCIDAGVQGGGAQAGKPAPVGEWHIQPHDCSPSPIAGNLGPHRG